MPPREKKPKPIKSCSPLNFPDDPSCNSYASGLSLSCERDQDLETIYEIWCQERAKTQDPAAFSHPLGLEAAPRLSTSAEVTAPPGLAAPPGIVAPTAFALPCTTLTKPPGVLLPKKGGSGSLSSSHKQDDFWEALHVVQCASGSRCVHNCSVKPCGLLMQSKGCSELNCEHCHHLMCQLTHMKVGGRRPKLAIWTKLSRRLADETFCGESFCQKCCFPRATSLIREGWCFQCWAQRCCTISL